MTQEMWTAVDNYIVDALGLENQLFRDVQAACDDAGLPPIQVSASQGKLLEIIVRMTRAQSVLEIGTLGGYSTIWMANGLPPAGRVVTLEIDVKHAEVAAANFARAGLSDRIDLRIGPALETLPVVEREGAGPFDLIFIDADKVNIPSYFEWALRLSRFGSVIIVDNVVREGAVLESQSADPSVQGVRRLNEMIPTIDGIESTVVQTVGVKGYDGFTIIFVRRQPS
jgi:predicted O-methyltransferase YrrM